MKARNQSGALTFPSDLTTHGMLFMFSEYKFSAVRSSSSPSVTSASRGSIILPFPMNMEDTLNIRIGTTELGNFGDIIAQGSEAASNIQGSNATDIMSGATGNVFGALKQILPSGVDAAKFFNSFVTGAELPAGTSAAISYLARLGVEKTAPAHARSVEAGIGTAFNPKQALLFESVNLKRHQWQWNLTPRSVSDSDMIMSIIRTFKRNALPASESMDGVRKYMLKYPNTCEIKLLGVDSRHFIQYKPIMIENISVNYSPNNGPSILAGGRPSSVILSVSGIETDMWTRDDIEIFGV
jgi:hypothetical protein